MRPELHPPTTTRHSPSPHDYNLSTARSVSHNTNKKRMKANERASNRSIERKSRFIRSRTKEPIHSFANERTRLIRSRTKEPTLSFPNERAYSFVPKRKSLSRSFANDLKRTGQNGERTTLSRIFQLNGFSHH
ncbi:hypothetical protein AVEN_222429-1 [Araneus ventricosus]|uniref:Uncharacterized protein n=1 Tax=Araneus ventricosus TaxID=182803 RepID=A0A4Y2J6M0_ARAVE|nr:hypothetical protein AVEN_222429-1 [Araneus ventricosus]